MGQTASAAYERTREKPNPKTQATLYYFAGITLECFKIIELMQHYLKWKNVLRHEI